VDAIESSGYCKRRPNPDDRRSSIIELTPAGKKALAQATKTFEQELELRLRSSVPARTLEQFSSSMRALRAASALADETAAA
jgi:MarR family transcriptional regulator, organic hydroperoxide resistance regulator